MFSKSCLQTLSAQAWAVACMWVYLKPKFAKVLKADDMNKLHLSFKRGILDEAFLEKYHAGLALEDIAVESFKFMQQFGIKALDIVKEMQISKCNASTLKAIAIHAHLLVLDTQFAPSLLMHALAQSISLHSPWAGRGFKETLLSR